MELGVQHGLSKTIAARLALRVAGGPATVGPPLVNKGEPRRIEGNFQVFQFEQEVGTCFNGLKSRA